MTLSIDTAVRGSRRLESLLEARFGAEGRGLHEKLSSVERRVPEELRRSIRWIATIRNKVVHEDGPSPADGDQFDRTVDRVARALEVLGGGKARAAAPKPPKRQAVEDDVDAPARARKRQRKRAVARARKTSSRRPRKIARASSKPTVRKATAREARPSSPRPLRLTARGLIWLLAFAAIAAVLIAVATR